jgi:hypothetical protein
MFNEKIKDEPYVKIKFILMIASFVWGIVILEQRNIIIFYQNNYPRVYVSFINFFIMCSLTILDVIYKVVCFFFAKEETNKLETDHEFMLKLENDFKSTDSDSNL